MTPARLAFSLSLVLVLGVCSAAASVPPQDIKTVQTQPVGTVPPAAPTLSPTVEPSQPPSPSPWPSPLPPFATITFKVDACSYDGPQVVSASDTLNLWWRVEIKSADVYGLLAFITDEPKSREELLQALKGLDKNRPELPAGLTSAGMNISYKSPSLIVRIKPVSGSLHGLLYFGCWAAGETYDVLGPVEIK